MFGYTAAQLELGSLANNGGPTQTMALLPGSPAIDAGDSSAPNLPGTDQRGELRTHHGAVNIGAYQTQGFTLAVTSGNNQSTLPNIAFADPLVVTVTADDGVDPVGGGQINFAVPSSGASATLSPVNPVTIAAGGTASVTASAMSQASTLSLIATWLNLWTARSGHKRSNSPFGLLFARSGSMHGRWTRAGSR